MEVSAAADEGAECCTKGRRMDINANDHLWLGDRLTGMSGGEKLIGVNDAQNCWIRAKVVVGKYTLCDELFASVGVAECSVPLIVAAASYVEQGTS